MITHQAQQTCCVWATGKTLIEIEYAPAGSDPDKASVQKIRCFLGRQPQRNTDPTNLCDTMRAWHHNYHSHNHNHNHNSNKKKKKKKKMHNRNDNHSHKTKTTTATPTTTTIAATQITFPKYVQTPWTSQLPFHTCSHYLAIKSSHTSAGVSLIGEGYILHV